MDILLIEPNPDQAGLMRRAIAEHDGWRVTTLPNASAGARYIRHEQPFREAPLPDVILFDFRPTALTDVALLVDANNVRMERGHAMVIVPLVSRNADGIRSSLAGLGADDCFVKPQKDAEAAEIASRVGSIAQLIRNNGKASHGYQRVMEAL